MAGLSADHPGPPAFRDERGVLMRIQLALLLAVAAGLLAPSFARAVDSPWPKDDAARAAHAHDAEDEDEPEHAPADSLPHLVPGDFCGPSIPADEALGFVPMPEGDVFCPLIADPKGMYSFASYVRGTSDSPLGTDVGSVGIADRFPLMRWGGPDPGEGLQIGLEGAVFAQFDLNSVSIDLLNADYIVGLPITARLGRMSTRLRVYHQSSHLGDEFLLRSGTVLRENFSFEAGEALLSGDIGFVRLYGGGEYVFSARPSAGVITHVVHGGIELRQKRGALHLGGIANVRLVAALDVKAVQVLDWEPAYSARGGFEIGRARPTQHVSRRVSLLAEFYSGRSPYGQFYHSDVRYYGLGLHFEQ